MTLTEVTTLTEVMTLTEVTTLTEMTTLNEVTTWTKWRLWTTVWHIWPVWHIRRVWRILRTVHSVYPLARVGFIYWLCLNITISKYIWYLYIYKYVFINIYYRHWMNGLTAVPIPLSILAHPHLWPHPLDAVHINDVLVGTLPVLSLASSSSGVENFTYN